MSGTRKLGFSHVRISGAQNNFLKNNNLFCSAVFQDVCKQLQNRRIADDMDELEAYLPEDMDEDEITKTTEEVKDILKENDKQAKTNMNQVLDEFVQKQIENNEQPVEVGDNEAESVKDSDESDGEKFYFIYFLKDLIPQWDRKFKKVQAKKTKFHFLQFQKWP